MVSASPTHSSAVASVSFETGHEDMIHSCVFDYYGKRLATASSDRTIRVFDVQPINPALQQQLQQQSQQPTQHTLTAQFVAHEGPIWSLAWAHPKFGSILASCSYDGRICIWKETITQSLIQQPSYTQQQQPQYQPQSQWIKIHEEYKPEVSINQLQFGSHTMGLCLAAACADGMIVILIRKDNNTWEKQEFLAHKGGVNSLSFAPDMKTALLLHNQQAQQSQLYQRRLVSGGCDGCVRIWHFDEQTQQWQQTDRQDVFATSQQQHNDWVRDVAWAPTTGLTQSLIASASEDRSVNIYSEDLQTQQFHKLKTLQFNVPVYKVSWAIMGNIIACSLADGRVEVWKEASQGEWRQINTLKDQQ